jgi:hypothetical protein
MPLLHLLSPTRLPSQENDTSSMAFVNRIPDQVRGLSRLKVVNDDVLKPGLSIVQTAKGYVDAMKKDKKPENHNTMHTIVIHTLSKKDRKSTHYEPFDIEFTDKASAERQRVNDLLNNRALNPPFPKHLPTRPPKQDPVNRWKVGFFGLLLIFAAAVISLSVIATKPCIPDCDPNQPGQQSTITVTATSVSTDYSVIKQTSVRVSTVTTTSLSIATSLITDAQAKETGLGKSKTDTKLIPLVKTVS